MCTFTFYVVEKVGRRKGLLWGAALGCIPMWYIGGFVMRADPVAAAAAGNTVRTGWGYLAMVAVYVNAFIICATWYALFPCQLSTRDANTSQARYHMDLCVGDLPA